MAPWPAGRGAGHAYCTARRRMAWCSMRSTDVCGRVLAVVCVGGCWQRFVREARSALCGRVVVICVGGCCVGACLYSGVCGRLGSPYGCLDSVFCG